jgi:hypothetical protein
MKTIATKRPHLSILRSGPALILVLALLASVAVTTVAQDEDLDAVGPDKMPEPTVVSQEMLPNGTTQTQVVIPVTQDTYVTSNQPTTNWCGSNWLRLGYNISDGRGAERIYLHFNMSSIPSNATINWARFEIYQHTIIPSGDAEQMGVQSRHLADSWNQCSVTWSSHQPDWGGVISTSYIPNTIGWISGDVTNLVKEWVDGSHPNNGVILIGDEREQSRERAFYSSRDFSRYPRLTVNYSEITDTEPPRVSVNPLPQYSPQSFTVSWGGDDPGGSGIAHYDVQYQVNGGSWISWINQTTATSATFVGSDGVTYGFRARGVDRAGNVQPFPSSAQTSTTVDTIPPNATVNALPTYIFVEPFTVSWSGTDNLSGIKCYDVQYREEGSDWTNAFTCTTDTSVQVSGAEDGKTYELRARATDNAGNVQSWSNSPQTQTTISTSGPVAWIVPFASPITRADSITVQWQAESGPGTSISYYNVRYRFERGSWVNWRQQTQSTQATLTDLNAEDGTYCFQAQASDSTGRIGDWGGQQCIAVDREPPFIEPQFLLPMLYRDFYSQ